MTSCRQLHARWSSKCFIIMKSLPSTSLREQSIKPTRGDVEPFLTNALFDGRTKQPWEAVSQLFYVAESGRLPITYWNGHMSLLLKVSKQAQCTFHLSLSLSTRLRTGTWRKAGSETWQGKKLAPLPRIAIAQNVTHRASSSVKIIWAWDSTLFFQLQIAIWREIRFGILLGYYSM